MCSYYTSTHTNSLALSFVVWFLCVFFHKNRWFYNVRDEIDLKKKLCAFFYIRFLSTLFSKSEKKGQPCIHSSYICSTPVTYPQYEFFPFLMLTLYKIQYYSGPYSISFLAPQLALHNVTLVCFSV